jgi:hypothetical protein
MIHVNEPLMNPQGLFTGKPDFALSVQSLKKGKKNYFDKKALA